ncbi:MAG: alanine racemase [Parcubacteria group bacterium]
MRALLRRLRQARFRYEPLIKVRIKRAALEHNYAVFTRELTGVCVAPVLKSNAYGHGLVTVAKIMDQLNPPFMVVDSYYEALVLRNECVRAPLLVIGYTPLANIVARSLPKVAFTIVGPEQLEQISRGLRVPRVFHLKIDTGMHRQGIPAELLGQAQQLIQANPNIQIEGLCTHLADADGPETEFTRKQVDRWNKLIAKQRFMLPNLRFSHVAATAGTTFAQGLDANVARVGLGLYGITSPGMRLDLRPALELVTVVASLRSLEPGECIGYNCTYRVMAQRRVATIPVGYFEGLDRRLSDKGSVRIRGRDCPILGRISMNITSVDVTNVPGVQVGDEVVVLSSDPGHANSIARFAQLAQTIPYDLLVHIPQHLRRVVV